MDSLETVDQRLARGPFTHVSPSPNGKSLALLTFTGLLWVVSTDFQRSMAEFDTSGVAEVNGPVRQVEWCGNDAILVTWDNAVSLIGPFGDRLQYVVLVSCYEQLELSVCTPQVLLLWHYFCGY